MLVLQLVEHPDDNHSSTYYSHRDLVDVFWWNTLLGPDTNEDHNHGRGLADIIGDRPGFISVWAMGEA